MSIILAFIFIAGLIIGSFLNVVILRTISNESIVFPGSKCPKCQNKLKWYHNIPVLSYIFLRGKCAFCGGKISIQYPIVELLTGILFTFFGYLYLNTIINTNESALILGLMFLISLISISLFIVISGTDFKEMLVSDKHTFSLIGLGLLYSIIIGGLGFYSEYKFGMAKWSLLFAPILYTLYGIIISFLMLEILRRFSSFILKTEAFGDGDSYIFAGIISVITSLFGASDLRYITVLIITLFFFSVIISVVISFPFYLKKLFNQKNWFLISLITAFIIYCTIYFYANNAGLFVNNVILICTTAILVILGLALCIAIFKSIKNNNGYNTQIPFGPSLCVSGLTALIIMPILLGII
jgi:leader peptidase (prepilin peptidase)/N-methyltransferase